MFPLRPRLPAPARPAQALRRAQTAQRAALLRAGPESLAQLFTTTAIPGTPAGVSELYLNEDIFVHNFGSDLPRSEAQELRASQRGASQTAFDTPSKTAARKTIPSWYFISSGDQIITPASELAMAKRALAHHRLPGRFPPHPDLPPQRGHCYHRLGGHLRPLTQPA